MQHDDLGPVGETKPWYASKGIWGSAIGALALAAAFAGYKVDEATQAVVVDQAVAFTVAGGALISTILTVWGRIAAKKAIG